MRRPTRFIALAFAVTATAATVGGVVPSAPVSAATYSMHVNSPIAGRIGIDGLYSPDDGNGYDVTTCAPGAAVARLGRRGEPAGHDHHPGQQGGSARQRALRAVPGDALRHLRRMGQRRRCPVRDRAGEPQPRHDHHAGGRSGRRVPDRRPHPVVERGRHEPGARRGVPDRDRHAAERRRGVRRVRHRRTAGEPRGRPVSAGPGATSCSSPTRRRATR